LVCSAGSSEAILWNKYKPKSVLAGLAQKPLNSIRQIGGFAKVGLGTDFPVRHSNKSCQKTMPHTTGQPGRRNHTRAAEWALLERSAKIKDDRMHQMDVTLHKFQQDSANLIQAMGIYPSLMESELALKRKRFLYPDNCLGIWM
jgi:hypothetical protein